MKTMKRTPLVFLSSAREAGAVLVTGLIFLAVLTILGVTSARMSSLEERMTGNMRDRAVAMQAAELALRDAEQDINLSYLPGASRDASGTVSCGTATPATTDDGICDMSGTMPSYTITTITWPQFNDVNNLSQTPPPLDMSLDALPSIKYGAVTLAPPISGLSAQPRYIVEVIKKLVLTGTVTFYRITVRAQGANSSTVVWLQEVFRPETAPN